MDSASALLEAPDMVDLDAVAIGKRITRAWKKTDHRSRAKFMKAHGLEPNDASKWCKGERVPNLRNLATIAAGANVSLHWLVFGEDPAPPGQPPPITPQLEAWMATDRGKAATKKPGAIEFMRWLPLRGRRPRSAKFYDAILVAWERDLSPEDAVLSAISSLEEEG